MCMSTTMHSSAAACKCVVCRVYKSTLSNHTHPPDDLKPYCAWGCTQIMQYNVWSPAMLKLMQPHMQLLHNTAVWSVLVVLLTSWHVSSTQTCVGNTSSVYRCLYHRHFPQPSTFSSYKRIHTNTHKNTIQHTIIQINMNSNTPKLVHAHTCACL